MDSYLNEDLYPIIASYLSSEDLDTFCNTYQTLSTGNTFWIRMIQERFGLNHSINSKFKYDVLYKGLLDYFTYDKEEEYNKMRDIWIQDYPDRPIEDFDPPEYTIYDHLINKYPGTLDYLFTYDVIKLPDKELYDIINDSYDLPVDLVKIIISKFDEIDYDMISQLLYHQIYDNNLNLVKLYYETCLNIKSEETVNNMLINYSLRYATRGIIHIDVYEYIMSKLNPTNDVNIITEFLSRLYDIFETKENNNELIKHILSKIPIDHEWNDDFINEIVQCNPYTLLCILDRFTFTKEQLNEYLKKVGNDAENIGNNDHCVKLAKEKIMQLLAE